MEATNRVTPFPTIPTMAPITTRPVGLSVETRIEVVASVIAEVLHNAYCTQQGLGGEPLAHSPAAVQRIYEGMARLSLVPLLDPDQVKVAEQKAIDKAADVLGNWMDGDPFDDGVPSDVWHTRIEKIIRIGIMEYQRALMGGAK